MDTSQEYIETCEKAVEVQELWEPFICDMFFDKKRKETRPLPGSSYTYYIAGNKGDFTYLKEFTVWLPRQDQLQGMLDIDLNYIFWNMASFTSDDGFPSNYVLSDYCKQFTSMEQLWLAYIMEKKFNKTWKDSEWQT